MCLHTFALASEWPCCHGAIGHRSPTERQTIPIFVIRSTILLGFRIGRFLVFFPCLSGPANPEEDTIFYYFYYELSGDVRIDGLHETASGTKGGIWMSGSTRGRDRNGMWPGCVCVCGVCGCSLTGNQIRGHLLSSTVATRWATGMNC